jgi:hypothetical protein
MLINEIQYDMLNVYYALYSSMVHCFFAERYMYIATLCFIENKHLFCQQQ